MPVLYYVLLKIFVFVIFYSYLGQQMSENEFWCYGRGKCFSLQ